MEEDQFLNGSGLEFTDISMEQEREYIFPNGRTLTIKEPLRLNVSDSGGHRVFSADGYCWYIQPKEGWVIKWKVKVGKPHFVR